MAPFEKKEKEKLPVHPNLSEIQARIDVALAKRAAIVDSWVSKYDTSRCAPDKTQEELKAWDEELYNPPPPNLGLGAEIPKEYLDGEGNRMMNAGNGKLRTLMLGGQKIGKKRDEREKEESRKRAKAESSDEEEGRASLVKSKKAKHKKSDEDEKEKEKPVKVEKVNKALLAMQKEAEEEKMRGKDNPWKNAPKPLSSLAKKKEKKKSKHAELLTELASTSVVQKTTTTTVVTPTASMPKKESPLPIRTINLPTSSSAPPPLGAPLNAAALALSVSASDTASTSTPSIASSGSPSRSMGVELTEEETKRKERLKEKKRKQKEAKKKKKAEALAAAKAVGGDAEMKDA